MSAARYRPMSTPGLRPLRSPVGEVIHEMNDPVWNPIPRSLRRAAERERARRSVAKAEGKDQ